MNDECLGKAFHLRRSERLGKEINVQNVPFKVLKVEMKEHKYSQPSTTC